MTTSNPGMGGTGRPAIPSSPGSEIPPSSWNSSLVAPTETGQERSGALGAAVDQASSLVDQATEKAKPRLENQKDRAVTSLDTTARALRQTSRQLREQEGAAPIANYAEQVADRVERVTTHLRQRDVGDLVNEVEDFARRQPVLFVGGAFTLGLLAARFLKSSGQRESSSGYQPSRISGYLPAPGQTSAGRAATTGAYLSPPVRPTTPTPPTTRTAGTYPTAPMGTAATGAIGTTPSMPQSPGMGNASVGQTPMPGTAAPRADWAPGSGATTSMPGSAGIGTGMTPGQTPGGERA